MRKCIISALLVLSMLLGIMLAQTSFAEDENPMSFDDVKEGDWFYSYVKAVFDAGAMQGKGAGKFEPESEMTRAEVVTVLCRLSGDEYESIDDSYSARFSDVDMTEWYVDYINWAVKSGLVLGYNDGTFRPDAPILRQEIAVLFVKFFDYIDLPVEGTPLVDKFADEDSFEGWAVEYIEALRATGLIGGDDNKNFNPEDNASRAEIATILTRLLPRLEEDEPETTEPESTTAPEESTEPETTEPETTEPETTEPETTEPEETTPDISLTDPNPDNIGVLYEYKGLKISEVINIDDTLTNPGEVIEVDATGNGVHGWHETRVVRTEYGTYVTYITEDVPDDGKYYYGTGENDYNTFEWNKFTVLKITSEGCKVIYEDWYHKQSGSCGTNVLCGENGMIYVTVIAEDDKLYLESLAPGNGLREAAWLEVFEIDTKTDTCYTSDHAIIDFEVIGVHGYGYSSPVLDVENGKIYAFINGGLTPGYIAWFIYDLETHTWDTECYTVEFDWRVGYFNAYPDGNGGAYFVAQRCVLASYLEDYLGVDFQQNGYVWDGLYLIHIPDVTKEELTIKIVYETEYKTGIAENVGWVTNYGAGGSLLSSDGKLHLVYTAKKDNKYTVRYAIYDTLDGFKELKNDILKIGKYETHRSNEYLMGLVENTNGDIFLLAMHIKDLGTAKLGVWQSTDGGNTFNKFLTDPVELKIKGQPDGSNTISQQRFSLTNSRNNSVLDNVVGIVTSTKVADGNGLHDYYYFAVELPH